LVTARGAKAQGIETKPAKHKLNPAALSKQQRNRAMAKKAKKKKMKK
jgi:hypothetical protein